MRLVHTILIRALLLNQLFGRQHEAVITKQSIDIDGSGHR